jgi:hypothetical protein
MHCLATFCMILYDIFVNFNWVVEYILLGVTPESELSESTFRNLVSVPSS